MMIPEDNPVNDSKIRLIERITRARKMLRKAITHGEKQFYRDELKDCIWVAEQKHNDKEL